MTICDRCGNQIQYEDNIIDICPDIGENAGMFLKFNFCGICVDNIIIFLQEYIKKDEETQMDNFNIDMSNIIVLDKKRKLKF